MTWAATLAKEKKDILKEQGFDVHEKSEGSNEKSFPHCLLIRPIHSDRPDTEWRFGSRPLLDLSNWHLQPIISDNF
jgi:hypothetical protein